MSTAGIASIALFAPLVASNAIFSARRASRGVDAMDENPLFALANFDIAAAQILKGGRAAKALTMAIDEVNNVATQGSKKLIEKGTKVVQQSTKNLSTIDKIAKGAGKVISFTADNINPIIVGAGVLKVAGSDDKLDTAARESTSLLCMFAAEDAMKNFVGMPGITKENGIIKSLPKEGAYKKLFTEKQLNAIKDYCATKKCLKYAAGGAKGLLFVGASIAGYKLGDMIATAILGEKKDNKKK